MYSRMAGEDAGAPEGDNNYGSCGSRKAPQGPQGAGLTCAAGFTSHSGGRLCMSGPQSPEDMHDAIDLCKSSGLGSRVCTLADYHQACGSVDQGASNGPVVFGDSMGWLGDKGVAQNGNWDDEYGTRNRGYCTDNFDGPALPYDSPLEYHCCY